MTNNTTAPALTDEQRKAVECAIELIENDHGDRTVTSRTLRALLTSPRAAVPAPDLYWFGDHEHGFECPDDAAIVHGRKLGERFTLKASWYADMLFEVTKVPDDNDDDYEVREVDAAPAAPVAEAEPMLKAPEGENPMADGQCSVEAGLARLRAAYCVQQPAPIPDQMALVWRADVMRLALDYGRLATLVKKYIPDAHIAAPSAAQAVAADGEAADDLLQLDVLLAKFHEAIWRAGWRAGAGDDDLIDFDLAGKDEAKAIQAHVRAMLNACAAVSPATAETCAHDYVRSDRVCTECGEKTATADERAAFVWPPLPDLPPYFTYTLNRACFTEHQMQAYANAYGEAVRASQAAAPAQEPVAWLGRGNYYTKSKKTAERLGYLMPVYDGPQPSTIPAGWMLVPKHRGTKPLAELIIAASLACVENRLLDDDDRHELAQFADQLQHAPQSPAQAAAPARIEALRKGLFNARDALQTIYENRVTSNAPIRQWIEDANRVLNGEQAAAPADTIDRYQAICSAAYQLAGVVGAPLRFLDALSDAANGEPMSADEALNLLPVGLDEIDEVNRSAAAPAESREPDAYILPYDLEVLKTYSAQCQVTLYREPRKTRVPLYAGRVPADAGEVVAWICSGSNDFAPIVRDRAAALKLSQEHGDGKIVALGIVPDVVSQVAQGGKGGEA
ncbi:hypothetical protein BGLA2_1720046 [Burkholderia gladioli]|uniref:hypothetical protein n=1 Tax=Burkholderia gladioli TaxID=28095 RepID=UPI001CB38113|nr:hypothetical protein [Burkholderia gladioli]CAG9205423.1 hypothetical protein BGLA2_1720046 [Burkholderia gladioli]